MSKPTQKTLARMLQVALVEIRAEESLKRCQTLADIFHNLPGYLGSSDGDMGDAYEQMHRKASTYGLASYLEGLRAEAERD